MTEVSMEKTWGRIGTSGASGGRGDADLGRGKVMLPGGDDASSRGK
jgi:hypothetical protein